MGKAVDSRNTQGIILPAQDWLPEFLTPIGAGLTDSAYSQAGPRPGQVVPAQTGTRAVLEASGQQTEAIEIFTFQSGMPGTLEQSSTYMYRLATETDDNDWRRATIPSWLNGWLPAVHLESAVDPYDRFDVVVSAITQTPVLIYARNITPSETGKSRTYDYESHSWGAEVVISADPILGDDAISDAVTGFALPDGSVVAVLYDSVRILTYISRDDGATWGPYGSKPNPAASSAPLGSIVRARAAYSRTAAVSFAEIGSDITQHASNDLGASFDLVETVVGIGASISVDALPGGGFIVAYINGSSEPSIRLLSSAYDLFSLAPELVVTSDGAPVVTALECTVTVEPSGVIWLFVRDATTVDRCDLYISRDNGVTWEIGTVYLPFATDDVSTRIQNFASRHCRGDLLILHNWVASPGDEDGSIGCAFYGGWSNVWLFGYGGAAATQGSVGIPIEKPNLVSGWIATGTGTIVIHPADGGLGFNTSVDTAVETWPNPTGATGVGLVAHFEGRLVNGVGSTSALEAGARVRVADGSDLYEIQARFSTANVRFVDTSGATIADVTHDHAITLEFIISIDGQGFFGAAPGTFNIAYRTLRNTRWTILSGVLPSSGTGTDEIAFGNPAIGINATRFFQWHWNNNPLFFQPGNSGGLSGLPLNIYPYPIRDAGNSLGPMRLAATRGPALRTQTFDIDPVYDYGIDRIFPTISPSPSEVWRSTDKSEQLIVMDMGADGMIGPTWGACLYMAGCNFAAAVLESSPDGITWTARGTWNASTGFETLEYERNGDWIRPDTGGAGSVGDRNLQRNEVVAAGGYLVLDGTHPVKVVSNGAGGWDSTPGRATVDPNMRVALVSGEGASGDLDIVIPSGVSMYVFPDAAPAIDMRFWRIRIPANQITPDSYYQIGVAMVGSIAVYGKRTSAGRSDERRPNVTRTRSRRGTLRQRQQGPVARQWVINWADGAVLGKARAANADYVGANAPLAITGDVPWMLHGVLEEIRGGEIPIVSVADAAYAASGMVTDRTLFLYGLVTGTLQSNLVTGKDGSNEFERVDGVTIDEQI